MSDAVSGLATQIFQRMAENQSGFQKSPVQGGGRSFESYMQAGQNGHVVPETQAPNKIESIDRGGKPVTNDVNRRTIEKLEENLRQEVMRTERSGTDFKRLQSELFASKGRFSLLSEASQDMNDLSPVTKDLSGRFIQVENEYKAIEAIMNSNENLSSGQLLALQAKLYQVGQHIEVMSKVVDQMAGGIKTVLNTNV